MAARASRPWRRAAAFALALHAVLFALAVGSVKILKPPAEPQAIGVQLIQLQPPRRPASTPPPSRGAAAPAQRSAPPAPSPSAVPAPLAPEPMQTPSAAPEDEAAGRVRAMLRGSSGCDSADFLKLSEAEQRKCAGWRTAHVDPNLQIPAPIDPIKKSWFDASLRARERGQRPQFGRPHPPRLILGGCGGASSTKASVSAGPCHIGIPGMFNDDDVPPP